MEASNDQIAVTLLAALTADLRVLAQLAQKNKSVLYSSRAWLALTALAGKPATGRADEGIRFEVLMVQNSTIISKGDVQRIPTCDGPGKTYHSSSSAAALGDMMITKNGNPPGLGASCSSRRVRPDAAVGQAGGAARAAGRTEGAVVAAAGISLIVGHKVPAAFRGQRRPVTDALHRSAQLVGLRHADPYHQDCAWKTEPCALRGDDEGRHPLHQQLNVDGEQHARQSAIRQRPHGDTLAHPRRRGGRAQTSRSREVSHVCRTPVFPVKTVGRCQ